LKPHTNNISHTLAHLIFILQGNVLDYFVVPKFLQNVNNHNSRATINKRWLTDWSVDWWTLSLWLSPLANIKFPFVQLYQQFYTRDFTTRNLVTSKTVL